uniref:DUF4283 domain-containing protein n=1 Tax=Chenopodium quinoa TaxID=63459 RepID=A0A803MGK8_CHEQI
MSDRIFPRTFVYPHIVGCYEFPPSSFQDNFDWNCTVIGKFWDTRKFSVALVQRLVSRFWHLRGPVTVHCYGTEFVFCCSNEYDADDLDLKGWVHFKGSLMVLQRLRGHEVPENMNLNLAPMWVQVQGLPIRYSVPQVASSVLQRVGDLLMEEDHNERRFRKLHEDGARVLFGPTDASLYTNSIRGIAPNRDNWTTELWYGDNDEEDPFEYPADSHPSDWDHLSDVIDNFSTGGVLFQDLGNSQLDPIPIFSPPPLGPSGPAYPDPFGAGPSNWLAENSGVAPTSHQQQIDSPTLSLGSFFPTEPAGDSGYQQDSSFGGFEFSHSSPSVGNYPEVILIDSATNSAAPAPVANGVDSVAISDNSLEVIQIVSTSISVESAPVINLNVTAVSSEEPAPMDWSPQFAPSSSDISDNSSPPSSPIEANKSEIPLRLKMTRGKKKIWKWVKNSCPSKRPASPSEPDAPSPIPSPGCLACLKQLKKRKGASGQSLSGSPSTSPSDHGSVAHRQEPPADQYMNVGAWNCRGIGTADSPKVPYLSSLVRSFSVDIMFIMETLVAVDLAVQKLASLRFDGFYGVDSQGLSGGLVVFWFAPLRVVPIVVSPN